MAKISTTPEKKTGETFGTKVERTRNTKSTRIWFMVLLIAIIILLYVTGIIKK
jgi:hypothetical protein